MPAKQRNELYGLFATGNKPTHDDFVDLIDSMINIAEDGIGISEKGKPMELIQQGTNRRLLDFSSEKDSPMWRINAQSANQVSGLNVASNNQSRLFIKQDNGFTGINNDAPAAKLHITPDQGSPALQVDDKDKNPALVVGSGGEVGIGANPQGPEKLTVNGSVQLKGDVTISGGLNASHGITVSGTTLNAQQGLNVQKGASISGALEVSAGLTVNGAALNANKGAVISGASLKVDNGLNVSGEFIVNDTFEASGEVFLGCPVSGDVTLNGALKFGESNIKINTISSSDKLAEQSDSILPTQKAVKTYIDNGLAQKADQSAMETALAAKADQSAVENALATKADQSLMETALAAKADQLDVEAALATKADQSAMETALAAKVDQLAVEEALATKADQTVVENVIEAKADKLAVITALEAKANQTEMDTALAAKADKAVMETALATKANQTEMDTALAAKADKAVMETALATKANQTEMDTALAAKADKAVMETALAAKANQTEMDTALAAKADKTVMETALATKADRSALETVNTTLATKSGLLRPDGFLVPAGDAVIIGGIGLATDSRGLMMVLVKDSGSGLIRGTAIFGVHGTDTVTKIAGEGMSDQQDGNTFNIYYNAGLTIQNTSTAAVTATVTYFGA
jgi:hypothetical protein